MLPVIQVLSRMSRMSTRKISKRQANVIVNPDNIINFSHSKDLDITKYKVKIKFLMRVSTSFIPQLQDQPNKRTHRFYNRETKTSGYMFNQ